MPVITFFAFTLHRAVARIRVLRERVEQLLLVDHGSESRLLRSLPHGQCGGIETITAVK